MNCPFNEGTGALTCDVSINMQWMFWFRILNWAVFMRQFSSYRLQIIRSRTWSWSVPQQRACSARSCFPAAGSPRRVFTHLPVTSRRLRIPVRFARWPHRNVSLERSRKVVKSGLKTSVSPSEGRQDCPPFPPSSFRSSLFNLLSAAER